MVNFIIFYACAFFDIILTNANISLNVNPEEISIIYIFLLILFKSMGYVFF